MPWITVPDFPTWEYENTPDNPGVGATPTIQAAYEAQENGFVVVESVRTYFLIRKKPQ